MSIAVGTARNKLRTVSEKLWYFSYFSTSTLHLTKYAHCWINITLKISMLNGKKIQHLKIDQRQSRTESLWCVLHYMWRWQIVCGSDINSVEIRYQERIWRLVNGQAVKSAVAQHILNTQQEIQHEETNGVNRKTTNTNRIVKGAAQLRRNLQQGGWLHIKAYMAAGKQFT
jgi:hypothetical protein